MSAVTRRTSVPVDVDTLMFWETVARIVHRLAGDIARGMGADAPRSRFSDAIDVADYAQTLADEIHGYVVGVES